MKPTQKNFKICPSREKPVYTIEHGNLGKHSSEETILLPLGPITLERSDKTGDMTK